MGYTSDGFHKRGDGYRQRSRRLLNSLKGARPVCSRRASRIIQAALYTRVRNVHGRTISGPRCVRLRLLGMYRVKRSDTRENSGGTDLRSQGLPNGSRLGRFFVQATDHRV